MFAVNDIVHYGGSGLCLILEIATLRFGRIREKYYVLKPLYGDSSYIYVPVENEALVSKMHAFSGTEMVYKKTLNGGAFPKELDIVVERFYTRQLAKNGLLNSEEKEVLVKQLISVYEKLEKKQKIDLLIPARATFLEDTAIGKEVLVDGTVDYFFRYKWPSNPFDGTSFEYKLSIGEQYDRIGGEGGRYLSPIKDDGTPETYLARAIPYYIPEVNISENPSYHRYTIKSSYVGENGKPIRKGVVAHAFYTNPKDGGGIQIVLPKPISSLKKVF